MSSTPHLDEKEIREVLLLDLKACWEAFEADNFGEMVIFSNRFLSNTVLFESKSFFLPGFILRMVAIDFQKLQGRGLPHTAAKPTASPLFDRLENFLTSEDADIASPWSVFYEYAAASRSYHMNDIERKVYRDIPAASGTAVRWALELVEDESPRMTHPSSAFVKGILNELKRMFRVHGFELADLCLYSILTAFDWYFEYVQYEASLPEGYDEQTVKESVTWLRDRLKEAFTTQTAGSVSVEAVSDALWQIVVRWRESFAYFFMLPVPVAQETRIELPAEIRKRLGKVVGEALKKELKEV